MVIIFSVTLLVVLLSIVFGLQKKNIADLSRDIKTSSAELKNTKNLDRMLTVQNQLTSLNALHDGKPAVNRLYKYVTQLTPTSASISRLNVDFSKNTITVTGSANSLNTINTFADALKFATYTTEAAPKTNTKAFSAVVLSTFGRDAKSATYTLDATFDPVLFSEKSEVALTVPNISTRTGVLFKNEGGQ
jgi:ABC-type antimicrobial peptide transport system permease subunit